MEGQDYYTFKNKRIDADIAKDNFAFWAEKMGIPEKFDAEYKSMLEKVKKMFGAHTFPYHIRNNHRMEYPVLKIFGHEKGKFYSTDPCGLLSRRMLGGQGGHMERDYPDFCV